MTLLLSFDTLDDSFADQTHRPLELCVYDDGSSDNSTEILKSWQARLAEILAAPSKLTRWLATPRFCLQFRVAAAKAAFVSSGTSVSLRVRAAAEEGGTHTRRWWRRLPLSHEAPGNGFAGGG